MLARNGRDGSRNVCAVRACCMKHQLFCSCVALTAAMCAIRACCMKHQLLCSRVDLLHSLSGRQKYKSCLTACRGVICNRVKSKRAAGLQLQHCGLLVSFDVTAAFVYKTDLRSCIARGACHSLARRLLSSCSPRSLCLPILCLFLIACHACRWPLCVKCQSIWCAVTSLVCCHFIS